MQRYHYQTKVELNEDLQAFLLAYKHATLLKTLHDISLSAYRGKRLPLSLPGIRPRSPWEYTPSRPSC